ncbi:MAG TPA: hypothetical protein VGT43_12820 [Burkholderiales bacterium]|nr:hypothetical protein [Burkholderiales bacterium]
MKQLLQGARTLSPYLLVELLLPGGTLIALLLWLFQHWKKGASENGKSSAIRTAAPGGSVDRFCTNRCA